MNPVKAAAIWRHQTDVYVLVWKSHGAAVQFAERKKSLMWFCPKHTQQIKVLWRQNKKLWDANELLSLLNGGSEDANWMSFERWVSLPHTLIVSGDERNTHAGEMAVQAEDRCKIKERWVMSSFTDHHCFKHKNRRLAKCPSCCFTYSDPKVQKHHKSIIKVHSKL